MTSFSEREFAVSSCRISIADLDLIIDELRSLLEVSNSNGANPEDSGERISLSYGGSKISFTEVS